MRGADRLLVAVHFRGVDMAIAERERALDRRAADVALHAKGAEPEPRQADALGLQMFHDNSEIPGDPSLGKGACAEDIEVKLWASKSSR